MAKPRKGESGECSEAALGFELVLLHVVRWLDRQRYDYVPDRDSNRREKKAAYSTAVANRKKTDAENKLVEEERQLARQSSRDGYVMVVLREVEDNAGKGSL